MKIFSAMKRAGGLLAFLCCSTPYMVWKVSSIGNSLQKSGILGSRFAGGLGAELCIAHDRFLGTTAALVTRHGVCFNQDCQIFQRYRRNHIHLTSLRGGSDMEDKDAEQDDEPDEYEVLV